MDAALLEQLLHEETTAQAHTTKLSKSCRSLTRRTPAQRHHHLGYDDHMDTSEARRLQLKALWRSDRGDFMAEYRRVVGGPPDGPGLSLSLMIDRIIERESSAGRLGS